ncbi:GNAT family N-acetyltransferase [Vibrio caribbeanicus]|uniref:Spermine/spermidine acetyltransferase n=1 Tax=Vibrio caribbeanicus ATCC BAA-2122 TaxID=796620 RepID=E3BEM9_9VIBR|nr:GNAT family N-acetyltransferase [Vibrio caribbeanicus]EFP98396.1 spermine/spermidine acetyltransferase [Vibrio caribbeanicus ATCC BAA-2122]
MSLELRKINQHNFYEICQLKVAPHQRNLVDTNALSLAEANFMPCAWFKGVYLENVPIGFILINADPERLSLWRLMIDSSRQNKGYGREAIRLLKSELVKEFCVSELYTSVVPGPDSPIDFYISCGFQRTGEWVEGREIELSVSLVA